jgi:hypothetical protein
LAVPASFPLGSGMRRIEHRFAMFADPAVNWMEA